LQISGFCTQHFAVFRHFVGYRMAILGKFTH
jgi:hypothetical protein